MSEHPEDHGIDFAVGLGYDEPSINLYYESFDYLIHGDVCLLESRENGHDRSNQSSSALKVALTQSENEVTMLSPRVAPLPSRAVLI